MSKWYITSLPTHPVVREDDLMEQNGSLYYMVEIGQGMRARYLATEVEPLVAYQRVREVLDNRDETTKNLMSILYDLAPDLSEEDHRVLNEKYPKGMCANGHRSSGLQGT